MFRCVLRNKEGDFLSEKYGECIFDCDMTYFPGVEEILKKGGSLIFTYVGELGRVETEEGFI
jgi:hypothetical protein